MLQRKRRTIRLWTGLLMLTMGIIVGVALSAGGVFAGAAKSSVANPPVTKASEAPAQDQAKQELDKNGKPLVNPKGEASSKGTNLLPQSNTGPNPPQGYTVVTSTGVALVPGTADSGNHTDDGVTNIALPFTFNLYGTPFNSVNASSNGNLQFSSGDVEYLNACLPETTFGFTIFPYWDDQMTVAAGTGCPVGGCGIFTSTSGSAPNRIFNIEWRSCVYNAGACGAQLNYEARLHEGSQMFDIVYAQLDPATNGGSATVGVQYANGALFTQFECNTANSLVNGEQLRFTYNPGTDPTFTPLPTNTSTNTSLPTSTPTNTATATSTPNCTPASYTVATGTATLVAGTTDIGNHTDDGTTVVTLPFAFNFYGVPYTTANVSSNGNLQFTSASTALTNSCLPTTSFINAIMPHWDDLRTDQTGTGCTTFAGGCGIFTSVSGVAPNRIFNIEWRAVYFSPNTTALNFEVRLFETSGQIQFIYATVPNSGVSATIGVQQGSGTGGFGFTQYSCNTASISNGMSITLNYVAGNCASPTPTSTLSPTLTRTFTATPVPCGPGSNYVVTQGAAAIVPGTDDTGNHTDDGTTLITLPFTFNLYATLPFTQANVSSNGNLQFTSNTGTLTNACLPTTTLNNAIMAYWDDLRTDAGTGCSSYPGGCGVFTSVSGVAPNRIFNIEWRAIEFATPANLENFEIRLYEGANGVFDLVYGTTASGGASATIGVQKDTGSLYTQHSCNTVSVSSGVSLNFAPFPCGVNTFTPTVTRTPTLSPTFTSTLTPTIPPTATGTPGTCGPTSNYVVATGTATIIAAANLVAGSQADDAAVAIALPFTYNLYGQAFNSVNAITNGNLQFGSSEADFSNICLPDPTKNNMIAPHWDDLLLTADDCGAGCGIYTSTVGSAPNRTFVVEWRGCIYDLGACAGDVNFEVVLYEGQNKFDFIYGVVTDNGGPHPTSEDAGATVGVQRGVGPQITQYSCETASLSTGLKLTFTQPSCGGTGVINGQVTWQSVAAANRPNVTGTLQLCVGGAPQSFPFTTDTSGNFTVTTGLPDGTYNWLVRGGRHLDNSSPLDGTAVVISGGSATKNFGLMKGGNTNRQTDNIVNASDFTNLKNQFGQSGVKSADFDYNLVVNASDFTILKNNFGQAGHNITCP